MAVWFMRRLQCLFCEENTLSRAAIAINAGRVKTPTNDRRDNVLRTWERAHALSRGGAIDPSRRQTGPITKGGIHDNSNAT
jgi:hypothetical protein